MRKSPNMKRNRFIHDFPSCIRTYATLCIYSNVLAPDDVTSRLGLKPDRVVRRGDLSHGKTVQHHGWFLTSQGRAVSRDLQFHIAYLMKRLIPRRRKLVDLKKRDCDLRIICFWESASGNGGPQLDHEWLQKLGNFPIDVDFDIWFPREE